MSRRCTVVGAVAQERPAPSAHLLYTNVLWRQGHGNHSVRRPGVSRQAPMSACATRTQGACKRVVPTPKQKCRLLCYVYSFCFFLRGGLRASVRYLRRCRICITRVTKSTTQSFKHLLSKCAHTRRCRVCPMLRTCLSGVSTPNTTSSQRPRHHGDIQRFRMAITHTKSTQMPSFDK